QNGNLENVGYAANGKLCIYNIDMMEETTSILAHGANAMTKRVFGFENRVERIPNPKDVLTYGAKLDALDAAKRKLFLP
ncbi:MAG: coproporphyrinogen dehydrogenase HemZ, partial [Clostridia bacterium]|nr:coproporphyrinogen dehydrogenase HemZ [Clostridia bacterium]